LQHRGFEFHTQLPVKGMLENRHPKFGMNLACWRTQPRCSRLESGVNLMLVVRLMNAIHSWGLSSFEFS
jgi:hypothetical protein